MEGVDASLDGVKVRVGVVRGRVGLEGGWVVVPVTVVMGRNVAAIMSSALCSSDVSGAMRTDVGCMGWCRVNGRGIGDGA